MLKNIRKTGYIHLVFDVGSEEKVNELTEILKNNGYEILSVPGTTGDGYYENCILAVEDNQI